MLIRHHDAVELVERMLKLKIISRSIDHLDGRRVLLQLTRKGMRSLHRLHSSSSQTPAMQRTLTNDVEILSAAAAAGRF
jgi:DNA-binding MarR family transcriptional regulator